MGQLEDMQVFIRVVESGGIGRAAEQLGMVKSAVSRRLSELEKRLGTLLINRTTRTSSLTDTGKNYYQQVLKIVDQVAEIDSEVRDADCALSGTIRLAAPLSFGIQHLGPAIDLFLKQHPDLSVHIDFSDRQVDIVEDGFDLALRIAELKDSSNQARVVCPCHHVLLASPAYLEQNGTPQTANELDHHRFIRYAGDSITQWVITDSNGKRYSPNLDAHIIANNGDFLLQMACAGHGIVILPTFIAWKALAAGDLVRILPDCELPSLNAYFIYPRNRYLPRRIRSLIDFIVERFGSFPYWDQSI